MIDDVIRLLEPTAKNKHVSITMKVSEDVPSVVLGDPLRMKQIFTNIFGNSLKFTETGSISVNLDFKDRHLICSVRDTGCGITSDERQRLFKPFGQATAGTSRRYGGTGLGLNFSKQLARLMGGDLNLFWSEPGRGSEFTFSIPVEVALPAQKTSDTSPPPATFDFKHLKILLVDDSAENREIVMRYLSPTGAQVTEAENGRECLQKMAGNNYDMVLMDIQMPDIDGLEATHILRQQSFRGPIIALTASAINLDIQSKAFQSGMNGCITKPFNPGDLSSIILEKTKRKD